MPTATGDPRLEPYARFRVDTCVGAQSGRQVLVEGSVLTRQLLEEIAGQIGRRNAYRAGNV